LPLSALAAPSNNATSYFWLRVEGIAHYVPSARCRLLGMVEEDVIFPTNPYGLVRVESLLGPEQETIEINMRLNMEGVIGTGQKSGEPFQATGSFKTTLDAAQGIPKHVPLDPAFVLSPLDSEVAKCTGVFQTSGALVFFPDGTLNGQMDGGTFFFVRGANRRPAPAQP
jgi:hypothetical protein